MVTPRKIKEREGKSQQRSNAKELRRRQTDAERKFWFAVRGRQLGHFKFKRQYPVGPYIADFVCIEAKLIVELDGDQHALRLDYDRARDAFLASQGFRVVRIMNYAVLTNTEGVLDMVGRMCAQNS